MYQQGEIVFVDLNPTRGHEESKVRPCVVISNAQYNHFFNTVIIAPISSAPKYRKDTRYVKSPLFIPVDVNEVHGTLLLQHIRSLDIHSRIKSGVQGKLSAKQIRAVTAIIQQFF